MANTRDILGDQETLDLLVRRQLIQLEENGVNKIDSYKFQNSKLLESVNFSNVTQIGSYCFSGCFYLKNVNIPSLQKLNNYTFVDCKSLNNINLSNLTTQGTQGYNFQKAGIGELIFPTKPSQGGSIPVGIVADSTRTSTIDINNYHLGNNTTFNNSVRLFHLLIREEENVLGTVSIPNPIRYAGLGWIYVPSNLVNEYKSATNWSDYAQQIVSLDEYPKQIQNETINDSWAQIFAAERDGTYLIKYNLGDIKYVNVGGTNLPMQIIAFDTDELAEGNQTAKITWLSLCKLDSFFWNKNNLSTNWEESDLRSWLRNLIYPQIESNVKNNIKPVIKTYSGGNPLDTYSTVDTIWIPSYREMFSANDNSRETWGVDYNSFFDDDNSRKRLSFNGSTTNVCWLRSWRPTGAYIDLLGSQGNLSSTSSGFNSFYGIILGFCT